MCAKKKELLVEEHITIRCTVIRRYRASSCK